MDEIETVEHMYALIREAIRNRKILAVNYRGSIREACPHVLGKKKGRAYTLLYQFGGETASGLKPDGSPENWRCLRVDELTHVAVRESGGRVAHGAELFCNAKLRRRNRRESGSPGRLKIDVGDLAVSNHRHFVVSET